jgi:hypothetical protein
MVSICPDCFRQKQQEMRTVFSKRSLIHSDSERLRYKIIHSAELEPVSISFEQDAGDRTCPLWFGGRGRPLRFYIFCSKYKNIKGVKAFYPSERLTSILGRVSLKKNCPGCWRPDHTFLSPANSGLVRMAFDFVNCVGLTLMLF